MAIFSNKELINISLFIIICRKVLNENSHETILEKTDNFEPKSLVNEEDMKNYFANFVKETSETNNEPIKSKEQITNKYYLNGTFLHYDKRR